MDIQQSQNKDFKVVSVTGEIDLNSSPEVRKVFAEIIKEGASKVIVDLEKTAYVDSSGLATLIEMMQKLKKNQGSMYLVAMSDKIKSLFEITKLDKLFTICRTQDEVLASY